MPTSKGCQGYHLYRGLRATVAWWSSKPFDVGSNPTAPAKINYQKFFTSLVVLDKNYHISGYSSVWQSDALGTHRPQVQILLPGPVGDINLNSQYHMLRLFRETDIARIMLQAPHTWPVSSVVRMSDCLSEGSSVRIRYGSPLLRASSVGQSSGLINQRCWVQVPGPQPKISLQIP